MLKAANIILNKHNPFMIERLYEWVSGAVLFLSAIHVYVTGSINEGYGYDVFDTLGIRRETVLIVMFLIGLVRLTALSINGAWKRTPAIRAICSSARALFFSLITFGGYPVVLAMVIGDIISAFQAGKDARKNIWFNSK